MSKLSIAQEAWRNLQADRAKARTDLHAWVAEQREEIERINEVIKDADAQFHEEWRVETVKRSKARDDAARAELMAGKKATKILDELRSNNTVWIYKLRSDLLAEGYDLTGTPTAQLRVVPQVVEDAGEPLLEDESPETETNLVWESSDHTATHRVLVDTTRTYIKKYGAEGTPYEGEWFIADMEHSYMAGNRDLYASTSTVDLTKRVTMLTQLLDGTYQGPIRLSPNPYKD